MPTTVLVDREIEEGRKLIEAMTGKGFKISAAFWYFATDMDEWRLMIQSPDITEQTGHRDAFLRIEKVRRKLLGPDFNLPLHKIALQSLHSPLVAAVRHAVKTTSGPKEGFLYIGKRIGVDFIEDVYVHFV